MIARRFPSQFRRRYGHRGLLLAGKRAFPIDHFELPFSSAANLLPSIGSDFAFPKVEDKTINCISTPDALAFARPLGLELDSEICAEVITMLVELRKFELARDVYSSMFVSGGFEPSPNVIDGMIICFVKLESLADSIMLFNDSVASGRAPSKEASEVYILELCRQKMFVEAFTSLVKIHDVNRYFRYLTYKILIYGLCSIGFVAEGKEVFHYLLEKRPRKSPAVTILKSLFYGFCKKGMILEAKLIFEEMERFRYSVDKVMYTTLINVCCKSRKMDTAIHIYVRMIKRGCEADGYTFRTLIHGFVDLGLFNKAWELCDWLDETGQLNDVACDFMMAKYCKQGKIDCAKALFSLMNRRNLVASIHPYTSLISALLMKNERSESEALYRRMLGKGIVPDHALFLILLKSAPKGRELELSSLVLQSILRIGTRGPPPPLPSSSLPHDVEEDIEILLEELVRRDSYLATVGYTIYVAALCERQRLDTALRCVQRMIDAGCRPLTSTFNSIIGCLCSAGLHGDVECLMKIMEEHGIFPDATSFFVIIKDHCRRRNPHAAISLMREMQRKGMQLNEAMYNEIISSLCKERRIKEAESIFQEIHTNLRRDEAHYTTMINGYLMNKKAPEALLLFENMKKDSIQPSCFSYTALIAGLINCSMPKEALVYCRRMLGDGFQPTVVMFTSLITHFLKRKELDVAFRLVDLMHVNNIKPDSKFYISLIKGVCRNISMVWRRYYCRNEPCSESKEMLLLLFHDTGGSDSPACYSRKDMKKCLVDIVGQVEDSEIVRSVRLYNAVILGWCWADRMAAAYEQFDLMVEDGLCPNETTYTVLFNAHVRRREIELAVALFNKMGACGWAPDRRTHKSLLVGLCKAWRSADALCVMCAMKKRGFPLSKNLYHQLLHSLCDGGCAAGAVDVMKGLRKDGFTSRPFLSKWLASLLPQEKERWPENLAGVSQSEA